MGELGLEPGTLGHVQDDQGQTPPRMVPFFSLSHPPVPNISYLTIFVEAIFLHNTKCIGGSKTMET